MLDFASASVRMVNSSAAVTECMQAALGTDTDCDLVIIFASMGHDHQALIDQAALLAPNATVVGSSCCGVVGSEGVSESMHDVALMTVRGASELAVAALDGIHGDNSRECGQQLAMSLREVNPNINVVLFLGSGIDIANDQVISGIEDVLGAEVTVVGATSSDNMKGITSFQMADGVVMEHGAWAVGFADPTLRPVTQATHGFVAVGEPMTVTLSKGNKIVELDGKPAWEQYTRRLALTPDATCGDTIPIGALAERLPEDLASEYGNDHILRVITHCDPDGTMHYPTSCPEGTQLWLTVRDEERIFTDMDRMMVQMTERIGDAEVVAVFHADCLARGRFLFNRVMKEELVGRMQFPLATDGTVPPWLGMYGFGEFARLGGDNAYHNYTTAIYALVR